jgi:hypothetical protein
MNTNIMNILCGYLPNTESLRYHKIHGLELLPSTKWTRAEVYYKGNIIYTIENQQFTSIVDSGNQQFTGIVDSGNIPSKQYEISMKSNNNNIILYVNNNIIMENKSLFYVEIKLYLLNEVNQLNETNFINYIYSMIAD